MDVDATKNVIEAALLAAGRPLSFDKLVELFERKGVDVDRSELRGAISSLADDYGSRGIEILEVASGYRVQVRSGTRDWLDPLFEERAPRYTRALLETLALVAYRQPITRAEIEEVRGVAVSSNIVRTLIERGWVRVVGYRDVPGKPSMLGTTREFLDYFGLKKLDDLPPLSELRDLEPGTNFQSDLIDDLVAATREPIQVAANDAEPAGDDTAEPSDASAAADELAGPDDGNVATDELAAPDDASVAVDELAGPDDSMQIADDATEPGDDLLASDAVAEAASDDSPAADAAAESDDEPDRDARAGPVPAGS